MPTTRSKGKGRASFGSPAPSERDPLLPSTINSEVTSQRNAKVRRSGSILLTLSIAALSLLLGLALFITLLANSFRPSESEIASLPKTAFKYNPSPESVSILNVTDDGILVNATILCGLDLDRAMGIKQFGSEEARYEAEQRGERGTGAAWWESLRRWAASKGLGKLSDRTVMLDMPTAIKIFSRHSSKTPLISVHLQEPMRIPLISGVEDGQNDWMQPVSVLALAKPVASTGELMEFGQKGWADGSVEMLIGVHRVVVRIPGLTGWMKKYANVEKENIVMDIQVPIPHFPGLPEPGHPIDFAKLVQLGAYHLDNNGDDLEITAGASMINFAKSTNINMTIPYGLPFSVVIPNSEGEEKLLSQVITKPVIVNHAAEDIQLGMWGRIIDDSNGTDGDSPLGPFIHKYLTGQDNTIIVRGMSTYPDFAPNNTEIPPEWAVSSLSSIAINLVIPGPQPPPKIINSMSMEHMRISRSGGKTRASGTVIVEIDLPGDIGSIDLDVKKVRPEVYMYDGPVPVPSGNSTDGYPEGAFGHINPEDYLNATTYKGLDPEFPNRLTVRAPLEDVPVEILPGRGRLLAGFMRKVVFKGGAVAGVSGTADAKVIMKGVKGKVALELPILGETWVGRQGLKEN